MNYSSIIAEDNPVDAEVLSDYLHKYFPEVEVVGSTALASEVKPLVQQHTPQILFLDIELTDGRSFEVLDTFNTDDLQIIFITSYNVFAAQAIRANAVDYILKPVDTLLLKKAVLKAFQRIEQRRAVKLSADDSHQKISVPTADGLVFIDVEKIIRIEASRSYATIITTNDKPILVSRTLLNFEKALPANLFMRVHDSYIVNRKFISGFVRTKNGIIKMTDGFETNLSIGKKESFLHWMQGDITF